MIYLRSLTVIGLRFDYTTVPTLYRYDVDMQTGYVYTFDLLTRYSPPLRLFTHTGLFYTTVTVPGLDSGFYATLRVWVDTRFIAVPHIAVPSWLLVPVRTQRFTRSGCCPTVNGSHLHVAPYTAHKMMKWIPRKRGKQDAWFPYGGRSGYRASPARILWCDNIALR